MSRKPPSPRDVRELLDDTRGAVFAEYVIILVLVVVASVLLWNRLHQSIEEDADEQYTSFGYPPDD